jgi:hypothetical protein
MQAILLRSQLQFLKITVQSPDQQVARRTAKNGGSMKVPHESRSPSRREEIRCPIHRVLCYEWGTADDPPVWNPRYSRPIT